MSNLRRLAAADLNLLVALAALLEEQSVTRAAARVGITQPAMSRALSRLRSALEDPLLVRAGRSMRPTPRGRELAEALPPVLQQLAGILTPAKTFDRHASHRFRLAMTDYAALLVLPGLQRRLARTAPRVELEVVPMQQWDGPASELASGELDGAVGFGHDVPDALDHDVLLEDTFVCAVRRGHPRVRKRLTVRQYTETPHVLVSSRGRVTGAVDVALARHGLRRHVAMVVPHFLVAPRVLLGSDYVATLARRIIQLSPSGLRCFKPPVEIPGFSVVLAQHPLQKASVPHAWLRGMIASSVRMSLDGPSGR